MELQGKLDKYLSTDPEHVTDALAWWYKQKHVYPCLHQMALDYLSIPGKLEYFNVGNFLDHELLLATSVDVKRTFSQGQLLLSHIHNWLCVQSTRALLCLGVWSRMDYVGEKDVKAAIVLPEVGLDEEDILSDDWDAI